MSCDLRCTPWRLSVLFWFGILHSLLDNRLPCKEALSDGLFRLRSR